MADKLCACGLSFTPNSYRQARCNACRFAPSLNPRNKITEEDVRVIRADTRFDGDSMRHARRYGITVSCVWRIVHRETWRHVS